MPLLLRLSLSRYLLDFKGLKEEEDTTTAQRNAATTDIEFPQFMEHKLQNVFSPKIYREPFVTFPLTHPLHYYCHYAWIYHMTSFLQKFRRRFCTSQFISLLHACYMLGSTHHS